MTTPDPANTAFPHAPINEPVWGIPRDEQTALLRSPLAGIELGTYDERILTWIVDICDTPTVAVIASLLHRARTAQPLDPADDTAWKFETVRQHLDVVLGKRDFADTEGLRAGLQYLKDFIQGLEFKDEQS
jgi:hypothetical protein